MTDCRCVSVCFSVLLLVSVFASRCLRVLLCLFASLSLCVCVCCCSLVRFCTSSRVSARRPASELQLASSVNFLGVSLILAQSV